MNDGFTFHLVGLPWWLVIPMAVATAWGISRLARRELEGHPRGIIWLRRTTVVLVLLFLLEPIFTRTTLERELPTVAIILDRTGSMDVDDRFMAATSRLDEAVTLGLVPRELRPDGPRRVARALEDAAEVLGATAQAVTVLGESWNRGAAAPDVSSLRARMTTVIQRLGELSPSAAALPDVTEAFAAVRVPLDHAVVVLAAKGLGDLTPESQPAALSKALAEAVEKARAAAAKADAAQRAADNALVAGAEASSPVAKGLSDLGKLSRASRAEFLVSQAIVPELRNRARVEIYTLGDVNAGDTGGLSLLPPGVSATGEPAGATDFAAPLSWLARHWTARHVGGVILVGDGRQTIGADPVPVVRALAARGARVAGVLIGDPDAPRDAVVAEVNGPAEIFLGESVHLDVRLRITGYPERDFDLVLTHAGREINRRIVRGSGNWQIERFEVPWTDMASDTATSLHTFTARLEPNHGNASGAPVRTGTGLLRDVWNGIGGDSVGIFRSEAAQFVRKPDVSGPVDRAAFVDDHENYASRLRGWLVPPATGEYTFWVSGDDQAELYLARSGEAADKALVAAVPEWTQSEQWDKYSSQRSSPVTLRAGEPCYIELLHKQGQGGGHAAVGWQTPDNRVERPILGASLVPWSDAGRPEHIGDPDPEASMANNHAECTVVVSQDPLRVLVIDGQPRWELRYLVAAFERDKRVQLTRRYRSVSLPRGERELLPVDQAELDTYDLVVLGDLAPGDVSTDDQVRLERFVGRRGGFLVAVAGPHGMPWAYSLGGLADVLPVRAIGTTPTARQPVGVQLTVAGAAHPITTILEDPVLNHRLWSALPRLEWAATTVVAKPAAEVLLTTNDGNGAPIVATSRYGAGRVLWVGSDDCWRWRDRLGDRVHQTFWLQAMRWGMGIRLRGKDRRLQAALESGLLEPGEAVDLRARATLTDGTSAGEPKLVAERLDDRGNPMSGSRTVPVFAPASEGNLWSVRLSGLSEGRWRFTVSSTHPELAALSEVRELVVRRRQGVEGLDLGTDRANMQRLTAAGGGRVAGAAEARDMAREFAATLEPRVNERRTTVSLWQNHFSLLVVLALLVVEWAWRKKRGLP